MDSRKAIFIRVCLCAFIFAIPVMLRGNTVSAKPFNIAITFAADSATEKNFTWFTKNENKQRTVLTVWETGGVPAVFYGSCVGSGENNVHKVTATGLKPGTKYFYRCGDGTTAHWSDIGFFETGVNEAGFSFLYMTDPQSFTVSDFKLWRRTVEHAANKLPAAAFFTISGDLSDNGSSEA